MFRKLKNIYPNSFVRSPDLFYLLTVRVEVVFIFTWSHSDTHTTVGRTPLDEGSARRRNLYLTTQTLTSANIHAPGGIRTHDPSKRSAADLRLRPLGHWDRLYPKLLNINKKTRMYNNYSFKKEILCVTHKPIFLFHRLLTTFIYACITLSFDRSPKYGNSDVTKNLRKRYVGRYSRIFLASVPRIPSCGKSILFVPTPMESLW
jgi:hypothetical protein